MLGFEILRICVLLIRTVWLYFAAVKSGPVSTGIGWFGGFLCWFFGLFLRFFLYFFLCAWVFLFCFFVGFVCV